MQGLAFTHIPAVLANLTRLEVLDFGGEPYSEFPVIQGGTLPPELSALTNLTSFGVTGPVTGQLPVAYSNWTRLAAFGVVGTALTGTLPPSLLTAWTALTQLTVDGAAIGGAVPDALFSRTLLQSVMLQRTPITGPAWFLDARAAALTQLRGLGFGGMSGLPGRRGFCR